MLLQAVLSVSQFMNSWLAHQRVNQRLDKTQLRALIADSLWLLMWFFADFISLILFERGKALLTKAEYWRLCRTWNPEPDLFFGKHLFKQIEDVNETQKLEQIAVVSNAFFSSPIEEEMEAQHVCLLQGHVQGRGRLWQRNRKKGWSVL